MKYRREIDGLRALAVLPVIFFHAGFKAFSGGYVGVDIFFVISGYLITTIILEDLNRDNFSLVRFYERRARRILPALFFVILCCIPFAWLLLPPSHFQDFSQSVFAVSAFSSNVLFWLESGYFDAAAELKPLLHTWSLAVEEQYYLLFPLFLLAFWKLRKRWIFGSLVIVAIISMTVAEYGAYIYPTATFYLLFSRGWELAIGALVAFYFLYKKDHHNLICSNHLVSELLGLLGLVLVSYSIVLFDNNTPFPSLYSLIPTLGTALIIVFASDETYIGRLLGSRILVGIGLISYSAYLWHQPLFVFSRHILVDELSVSLLLLLSVITLLLAGLSWRLVEMPFRNKTVFSQKVIFVFGFVGSLVFALSGFAGHFYKGFPERFNFPETLTASFQRSDEPMGKCFNRDNLHLSENPFCTLGERTSSPDFLVFGDSHALSLFNAYDLAANNSNRRGAFAGQVGCVPLLDIYSLREDQTERDCRELNRRVYDFVVENEISRVYLVAHWTYYTDGGYEHNNYSYLGMSPETPKSQKESRIAFEYGLNKTVEEYKELGVEVVVLGQIPRQKINSEDAYSRAYIFNSESVENEIRNKSVTYSEHKKLNAYVDNLFSNNEYLININLDKVYCSEGRCLMGTEETSYYYDDDHLSILGANRSVPFLSKILAQKYK